ncbi:MAG: hypothetical protein ACI841_002003 [Planctomycetota bacterium]|jgi:hypothetical protein
MSGRNQQQMPFGDGFRCVGGTTYRINPPIVASTSLVSAQALDFGAPYETAILGRANLNFQYWYRDQAALLTGFNLSDALSIKFQ